MRILIADAFDADRVRYLRSRGHEVDHLPDLDADGLPTAVAGFEALVVRSTLVTEATLQAADALQLVVRAGAGTNTIDLQAAADLGIYVCNVPGRNAVAVAELTMGLILALDRDLPDQVAELRRGRWDKRRFSQARGLLGRTLGILGLGAIGLEVAVRARAFGLRVLAVDKPRPRATEERLVDIGVELVPDRTTLLHRSDVVSLHLPLTEETRGIVDRGFLAELRDGAWIVNTSRGELVDGEALLEALDQRGMRAALDVFPDEPTSATAPFDSPLARHPAVYGTHHVGASTAQAQEAIAEGTVEVIEAFAAGEVRNCVNLETRPLGRSVLTVRHLDRVGVLSGILATLRDAGINVQQMENQVFRGANAAVAVLHLDGDIGEELCRRLAAQEHVIGVSVRPKGC